MRPEVLVRRLPSFILGLVLLAGCSPGAGTGLLALTLSPDPSAPPVTGKRIVLTAGEIRMAYDKQDWPVGNETLVIQFPNLPAGGIDIKLQLLDGAGCVLGETPAPVRVFIKGGKKIEAAASIRKSAKTCEDVHVADGGVDGSAVDGAADQRSPLDEAKDLPTDLTFDKPPVLDGATAGQDSSIGSDVSSGNDDAPTGGTDGGGSSGGTTGSLGGTTGDSGGTTGSLGGTTGASGGTTGSLGGATGASSGTTGSLGGTTGASGGTTGASGGTTTIPDAALPIPAPKIDRFTSSVPVVTQGGSVTLSWNTTDATEVTLAPGGETVGLDDTINVSPTTTTTYILTAKNSAGEAITAQVAVTVVQAPTITSFVSNAPTICPNGSATLTGVFAGGTGTINKSIGAVTSGQVISTGLLTETTVFTLTVTNLAGTSRTAQVTVAVAVLTPGRFVTLSPMSGPRAFHTASLLPGGKVLIAGGESTSDQSTAVASGELFDPVNCTFSPTPAMTGLRTGHTATVMKNGMVLLVGGLNPNSFLATAELYNPTTGSFSPTGTMSMARQSHSATLLSSGKVLITGGATGSAGFASAELYDPATGTFSPTGTMGELRYGHSATLLANDKVLIAGGESGSAYLRTAELYDPATGTFAPTGSMSAARKTHTATLLSRGQVLIAAGWKSDSLASAELYDPTTGTFSNSAGTLATSRTGHSTVALGTAKLLLVGGQNTTTTSNSYLSSAEFYWPSTGTFTAAGNMNAARGFGGATLLDNGMVLVTGGFADGFSASASVELYVP
jgi:hypothetical protein